MTRWRPSQWVRTAAACVASIVTAGGCFTAWSAPSRVFAAAPGEMMRTSGDAGAAAVMQTPEPAIRTPEQDSPPVSAIEAVGLRERVANLETAVAERDAAATETAGRVAALEPRVAALERDAPRAGDAAPEAVSKSTHVIAGSVTLYADEYQGAEQADGAVICRGVGGYDDMRGPMLVEIRDASDAVIASGRTREGERVGEICRFDFSLAGAPDGLPLVVLYVRAGSLVYRIGASSKTADGDPAAD
ncbi:MAG: hypothetical protein IT337_12035, partial [Thermomicrobiales bacterium]|nr:hypothetical protein [Thermomicrobiales bacterium]